MKAKDSLSAGVQIANTGYIYFDFNAPVQGWFFETGLK
jgi:hypothetical protein